MSDSAPATRRGHAAGWVSVAAGAAVALATVIGWRNLERAERRALEVEIAELQRQFATALDSGLQLRFAALAPLASSMRANPSACCSSSPWLKATPRPA